MSKLIYWKLSAALAVMAMAATVGIGWSKSVSELKFSLASNSWLTTRSAHTLQGHSTWVYAIAISPDGKTLASGSHDGTINVWNLQLCQLLHSQKAHSDSIESLAISPDGNILASGSWDNRIKLWDLKTGTLLKTLEGHTDDVKTIAINPAGTLLASGGSDKTIRLWNLQTGKLLQTLQDGDWVRSVAFSPIPEAHILASGSENGTIKIWNFVDGNVLRLLVGQKGTVHSVAFSPDGQALASGSADRTVKLWQVSDGKVLRTLTGQKGAVWSVAISPDGQTLASGSYDKTIKLWHLPTGKLLGDLAEHSKPVWSVAFSPNPPYKGGQGGILVSGSGDETIKVWSVPVSSVHNATLGSTNSLELKETLSEITDQEAIAQLKQKLYDQIRPNWQPTSMMKTDLVYRVLINEQGVIADYQPLNQEASNLVLETYLPKLRKADVSHTRFGLFKVVFKPSGLLEVSPWQTAM